MTHPTIEQIAAFLAVATDDEIDQVCQLAWPDKPLTGTATTNFEETPA